MRLRASSRQVLRTVLLCAAGLIAASSAPVAATAAPGEAPRAVPPQEIDPYDTVEYDSGLPRHGQYRSWDDDCRPPSKTMRVPSRLMVMSAKLTLSAERFGVLPIEKGSGAALIAHAADLDADGRSDLLAALPGAGSAIAAISTGSGFKPAAIPWGGETVPQVFASAVVLDGAPGKCARIMVPPEQKGKSFSMISWRDLKGLPPEQRTPALRVFESSMFFAHNDRRSYMLLGELDRSDGRVLLTAFEPGTGWFQYFLGAHGVGERWLGMGYAVASAPMQGLYETFNKQGRVSVMALGHNVGVTVSALPLVEERRPRILHGDFNGDSLTDFIYLRQESRDRIAWISLTFVGTPITVPIAGLADVIGSKTVLTAGDFDGDGSDELLLTDAGGALSIIRLRMPPIPPDTVKVTIDGRPVPVDSDGRFMLDLEVGKRTKIRFRSDTFAFGPAAVNLTASRSGWDRMGIQIRPKNELGHGAPYGGYFREKGPFLCTGWLEHFSAIDKWPHYAHGRATVCPAGYAMVELDDGRLGGGSCCPLPSDLLKQETDHLTEDTICPAGEVATGIYRAPAMSEVSCPSGQCEQLLRCTAIDTSRYRLLEDRPGAYWGDGTARKFGTHQPSRSDIPHGMRNGIGRQRWDRWDMDGCMPPAWGALLRGGFSAKGSECEQYRFARVEPLDPGTDPASPTFQWQKNPIFPVRSCARPTDPFNPFLGCEGEE